jgi:peptide chain release factor 2
VSPFDVEGKKEELRRINFELEQEGIWDDPEKTGKILQEKKSLEKKLDAYEKLCTDHDDIGVMIEMAEEADDESLVPEIEEMFATFKGDMESLKLETLLNGEYDAKNAILNIHAGSGGVDAQDWAGMLLRMYTRWAERKGYRITTLDLQRDDEEGIKNATLKIDGENAYGYLKNERGVHRLVRISPFDSNARRHTSFSSVEVSPEIDDTVKVEIAPEDLRIDT